MIAEGEDLVRITWNISLGAWGFEEILIFDLLQSRLLGCRS